MAIEIPKDEPLKKGASCYFEFWDSKGMTKTATNVEKMAEEENKKDENISKTLCTQQETLSPKERNYLVY